MRFLSTEFDKLDFTNDFLFCKILQNDEELCKKLVETITDQKIKKIVFKHSQEEMKITPDGKGIRLDVYLEDDLDTVYDLEMQTTTDYDLAKRSRYYQGMIDLNLLESGSPYSKLKKSFIIFICMKNPFTGKLLHKYSFENRCIENSEIALYDQSTKIIVTPDSNASDISEEMQDFLNYLVTRIPSSNLTKAIDSAVEKAKTREEWRLEYMTLHMRDLEKIEEGRKEERIKTISLLESLSKEGKSIDEILEIFKNSISESPERENINS